MTKHDDIDFERELSDAWEIDPRELGIPRSRATDVAEMLKYEKQIRRRKRLRIVSLFVVVLVGSAYGISRAFNPPKEVGVPRKEHEYIKLVGQKKAGLSPEERERVLIEALDSEEEYAAQWAVISISQDESIDLPMEKMRDLLSKCADTEEQFGDPEKLDRNAPGGLALVGRVSEHARWTPWILRCAAYQATRMDVLSLAPLIERFLTHHHQEARRGAVSVLRSIPGYHLRPEVAEILRADHTLMQWHATITLLRGASDSRPYTQRADVIAKTYWVAEIVDGVRPKLMRFDRMDEADAKPHVDLLTAALDDPTLLVRTRALAALLYGRGPLDPVTLRAFFDLVADSKADSLVTSEELERDGISVVRARLNRLAALTIQGLDRVRQDSDLAPEPWRVVGFGYVEDRDMQYAVALYLANSPGYVPSLAFLHQIKTHDGLGNNAFGFRLIRRGESRDGRAEIAWLDEVRRRPLDQEVSIVEMAEVRPMILNPDPAVRRRALRILTDRKVLMGDTEYELLLSMTEVGSEEASAVVRAVRGHVARSKAKTFGSPRLLEPFAIRGSEGARSYALRALASLPDYVPSPEVLASLDSAPAREASAVRVLVERASAR